MNTSCIEIYPGAFHLPDYLSLSQQCELAARCRGIGTGSPGWYVPTVRSGGKMRVRMVCLGWHWNARTYGYEATRSDHDGQPSPPLPDDLSALASRVAEAVRMRVEPDVCILNYYGAGGKMGLHQDKDEHAEILAAGLPIVSLSLGDTAKFVMGGFTRREPTAVVQLASGDAFVFGGTSRLRYHGVLGVLPGSGPQELGLEGRYNLTFRQGATPASR